jgi:acyl-CoA thioesterase-1
VSTEMAERLIRFQHPEKVLGYLGGLDDDRLATLFGLDLGTYQQLRRSHHEQARRAAADLLDDPAFAKTVDQLPFRPNQRVVAIGESTTDDLLSWFEILRHLLNLRRPTDGITLTNMAVSGQTSTQALTTLPGLFFHRPDWVLCMLGGNDAQRLGSTDGPTLVASPKLNATYEPCTISPSSTLERDGSGSLQPQSTRHASRPTNHSNAPESPGPTVISTLSGRS